MKIGGNVASLGFFVMAAFSLFLMVSLLHVDRIVHARAAFALVCFNVIAAITVQVYMVAFRRREGEQLVTNVAEELGRIEARPKESGRSTLPETRELMKLFARATRSAPQGPIEVPQIQQGNLEDVTIELQPQPSEVAEPEGQISDREGYILRALPRDKAFYFYEGLGKPTGEFAGSLLDFRDKIMTLQLSSLIYHMERKDIENWIEEVVGDPTLAERISKIARHDDLIMELQAIIDTRIKELGEKLPNQPAPHENLVAYPTIS